MRNMNLLAMGVEELGRGEAARIHGGWGFRWFGGWNLFRFFGWYGLAFSVPIVNNNSAGLINVGGAVF